MKKTIGVISFIGLFLSIFGANYFIKNVGVVCEFGTCLIPVFPDFQGAWIMAPSGVLWIGLSLTLRDIVQNSLGVKWAAYSILIGAILSAALSPALALASGVAFLSSEFMDMFVYTKIREKTLVGAVVSSNTIGLIVDSVVFLLLAFESLQFLLGQVIGKALMIIPAVILIKGIHWMETKYSNRYAFNS